MRETEAGPVTLETIVALSERRDGLYVALETQYTTITTLVGAKEDTTALEVEWVGLLREYEAVCDEIMKGM